MELTVVVYYDSGILAQSLLRHNIHIYMYIYIYVSADKTKYIVMSRDQNAGWSHSVRIDNSTFDRVEEFKYLGTTLTNQNSIAEEI